MNVKNLTIKTTEELNRVFINVLVTDILDGDRRNINRELLYKISCILSRYLYLLLLMNRVYTLKFIVLTNEFVM